MQITKVIKYTMASNGFSNFRLVVSNNLYNAEEMISVEIINKKDVFLVFFMVLIFLRVNLIYRCLSRLGHYIWSSDNRNNYGN